jgi:tRNA/rRNA methyltransferase
MSFWAYILHCSDGSYYTGHTDDLERRISQHQSGEVKGYTSTRLPISLVWSQDFGSRIEAIEAEVQVKDWSRAKKQALIQGDWGLVSHFAKPPSRRSSRHDVSTGSTSARGERGVERADSSLTKTPVRIEPVSSKAEIRCRDIATPTIILIRPQLGENIGKAARAMLNFGLTDLRLVAPRDGWPNPDAGPAAAGADIVLEGAQVYETVAEAVADCEHVYATTVRKRGVIKPVMAPDEAAETIWAGGGRTAILFGPERSGLENEDVAVARTIITVPINPEFGSLNLAQAVILVAYEWSKRAGLSSPPKVDLDLPAPQGELDGMIGQLDAMLAAAGHFEPEARAHIDRWTIRSILTKPGWSAQEVRTLRGVLRSLNRKNRVAVTPD